MRKTLLGVLGLAMAVSSFGATGNNGELSVPLSGQVSIGTVQENTISINVESIDFTTSEIKNMPLGEIWNPKNSKIAFDYAVTGNNGELLNAVKSTGDQVGFTAAIADKAGLIGGWTNEDSFGAAYGSPVYDEEGKVVGKPSGYTKGLNVAARVYNEDEAEAFGGVNNNLRVALTGEADPKLDGKKVTINGNLLLRLMGM